MNTSTVEATSATAVSSLGGSVAARVKLLKVERMRMIRFLFYFILLTEVTEH